MATIATDNTKTWNGEPAALKGLLVSVVATVLAIITGTTTTVDGGNAIALAVAAFVIPLVQSLWIRKSVTPLPAATEGDV